MHSIAIPETLQGEQRTVLLAAAQNRGQLEIATKADTRGRAVRAGRTNLYNPDDPTYAPRCCEAVVQLVELQLLRESTAPGQFEMTNFGWQLSRKLTIEDRKSEGPASTDGEFGATLPRGVEPPASVTNSIPVPTAEAGVSPAQALGRSQTLTGEAVAEAALARLENAAAALAGPSDGADSQPEMTQRLADSAPDDRVPELAIDSATYSLAGADNEADREPSLDQAEGANETAARQDRRPSLGLDEGENDSLAGSLISALALDDGFLPVCPTSIEETGLNKSLIDDLIIKMLQSQGALAGRDLANQVCLPLAILEDRFSDLRRRQMVTPSGSAMLGDSIYELTDEGRTRGRQALAECAYAGPAPVPLDDYIDSVQAQSIRNEQPKNEQLVKAFSDINVEPEMLARLGPAISAGKGMFVYGPPGNGKTTIAQRITRCFGQSILVPHAIIEGGQIIKFFDASCHEAVETESSGLLRNDDRDARWVRIKRPTVVVGGELTMDNLELKHDPVSHVSEASLQLKSNCGSLLIDDFGRQRVDPTQLLNRWIIPLENRIDFLSLANGKKVEVPFEQLIIFSTNLEPHDLADDAFLRRIPFKIEIGAPSREEYIKLLAVFAEKVGVDCPPESVDYLLRTHYDSCNRPLRRCQARDLLDQVYHYCEYNELEKVANKQTLDHAVENYFAAMSGEE